MPVPMQVKNISLDKAKIMRRMADARVAQGYSYGELADKTGISKTQLFRMEHDFQDGTALLCVMSVAKALHIDFMYLCGLSDDIK